MGTPVAGSKTLTPRRANNVNAQVLTNDLSSPMAYLQPLQLEAILFAEYLMYPLSHPTCKLLLRARALAWKYHLFLQPAPLCRLHPKGHPNGQDTKNLDC